MVSQVLGTFIDAFLCLLFFDTMPRQQGVGLQMIAWEECNSFPKVEALGAAAATERGSSHPLATAVVGAAAAAGAKTTMTVTDSHAVSGQVISPYAFQF